MRFAYARTGGPLLDWSGSTPPYQSRAGETKSLGDFYPSTRRSSALRRYGVKNWDRPYNPVTGGQAMSYDRDRPLGDLDVPRPGAPEIVSGYESPAPGAAIIHLGDDACTFERAHRRAHGMEGYMPEGSVRGYGQTMLAADEPKPAPLVNGKLVRRAAILAAAYHGVRRNNGSIFWGLIWAAAAFVAPLHGTLVPAFAMAQGYGEAQPKSNPAKRRRSGAQTVRGKRSAKMKYRSRMETVPGTAGRPAKRKRVRYLKGPVPLHNLRRRK